MYLALLKLVLDDYV